MMTPHRHLRLLLEDELATGDGEAVALAGALAALAGVGALDARTVEVLVADASAALRLRGRPPLRPPGARDAGPPSTPGTTCGPATTGPSGAAHGGHPARGEDPAHRYLWQLVAARLAGLLVDGSVDRRGDAAPAVAALVACGVLDPGDPLAAQVALTDEVALGLADEGALDARIRSVLDARDHLGASGDWPVGGPGATVDGHRVQIDAVRADGVQVLVTGSLVGGDTWTAPADLTATDDRGGWYVSLAPEVPGEGVTWVLVPSLDPEAARLVLRYAGPTGEATWEVGLA